MRSLIRQRTQSAVHGDVYYETELESQSITLGAAVGDDVQLSVTDEVPVQVQLLLDGLGRAVLKVAAPNKVLVNETLTGAHDVVPGDRLELGLDAIKVLVPPAGFDFALEVNLGAETPDTAAISMDKYSAAITPPSINVRLLTWLCSGAVLLFGLVIPLLVGTLEHETTESVPDVFTHAMWSSGELHVSHRSAVDGDCKACHSSPFERVPDTSCTQCHEQIAEHSSLEPPSNVSLEPPARCASCHIEHDKPESLVSDDTSQCSSCHEALDFSATHSEFSDYPHLDRTNIIFDHGSHSGKHFSVTQKTFECLTCHETDSAGQRMLIAPFESMCVDCHGDSESKKLSKVAHHGDQLISNGTLAFFSLPRLDTKQLTKRGVVYGYWPDGTRRVSRTGLTRLGLTPLSEFLLASETEAAAALASLRANRIKLASLAKADDQDIQNVLVVIDALRMLFGELSIDPAAAIGQRIETWLGRALGDQERESLSGKLSSDQVNTVGMRWFEEDPAFNRASLSSYLKVDEKTLLDPVVNSLPGAEGRRFGDWRENKYALQYQLSGHGDDMVRAWIELTLELGQAGSLAADREEVSALRAALVNKDAKAGAAKGVGRCSKCHDLASAAAQSSIWAPSWRDAPGGSAAFRHSTHVQNASSCGNCHTAPSNSKSTYLAGYSGVDGSHFEPMSKSLCTQCHLPDSAAGEACTVCHEYHPGHAGGTSWLLLEKDKVLSGLLSSPQSEVENQ